MDKELSIAALCMSCMAVGALAFMAWDQYRTNTVVRSAHIEMVRIATEQDIARRIEGGY